MGGIAERFQPLQDDGGIERAVVPLDRHALARQIDARAADAQFPAQALLDRDDAGAAIDPVDDKVHGGDAVGGAAHEMRKVLRFRQARLLKRDAKKWMPVFRKNPAFSKTLAEITLDEAMPFELAQVIAQLVEAVGLL